MRSLLLVFCLVFTSVSFANSLRDSIGVENDNGNQIILHQVKSKETYYSIGRLYNVSPGTIIKFNNNVSLHIGVVIKVPSTRPFKTQSTASVNNPVSNADIIEYKVGPREFLYSIAKRFNTTVEDLKELNNLRGDNLRIGQILKVRQGTGQVPIVKPIPTPAPVEVPITPVETPAPEKEKVKIASGRLGVAEKTERGVAIWIADENLDGTKMLALHRTAPPGTVVKVTNPMTAKVTFVKVVGKFTENESTKDVIIVLTKAAADLLGVLDKRFQITIDYGGLNE
jgi:LysM repeat protein